MRYSQHIFMMMSKISHSCRGTRHAHRAERTTVGFSFQGVRHPGQGHLTWSLICGHPMSLHDDHMLPCCCHGAPPHGIHGRSGQPPKDIHVHPLTSGPGGPVCPGGPCQRKDGGKVVRAHRFLNCGSDGALSKPTPHPPGPWADPTSLSEPRNPCTLGAAGEPDCHLLCDCWGSRWAGHGPVWGSPALTTGWTVHSSLIVPS